LESLRKNGEWLPVTAPRLVLCETASLRKTNGSRSMSLLAVQGIVFIWIIGLFLILAVKVLDNLNILNGDQSPALS
jgi:hypothetical protein